MQNPQSHPERVAAVRPYSPVAGALAWLVWTGVFGWIVSTVAGVSVTIGLLRVGGWLLAVGACIHVVGRTVPWLGAVAVALGTGLLSLIALDFHAFMLANQGLWVLWEIHEHEGAAGVMSGLAESGVGAPTVAAAVITPFVVGVIFARWWQAPARWLPRLVVAADKRIPLAVGIVAVASTVLLPGALTTPSLLRSFYGADRLTAHVVAAGSPASIRLSGPLPQPSEETTSEPEKLAPNAAKTVVLVIIESLRHDMVDASTMPNLAAFARTAVSFPQARSAANATHPSWYALLFSRHSLYWHTLRHQTHTALPPPLAAFAKAGYKIHIRSGAGFNYYGVSDAAFGRDRERVASFLDASTCYALGSRTRPQMDRCATDSTVKLLQDRDQRGERSMIILLYDSSHFPYAWESEKPRFLPVVEDSAALRTAAVTDATKISNRYRSALFSIDQQLGDVFSALRPLQRDGVIVAVTGDHGEELGEHGRLAHDSELCNVQTRVPLLINGVNGLSAPQPDEMGSHIDVIPTLLAAVGLDRAARSKFDGVPLQDGARKWAFVVHTSAGSPVLVALKTVDSTLELSLSDRRDITSVRELFLLQTYGEDPKKGVAVGRDSASRQAVYAKFGAGLAAVFGATRQQLVGGVRQRVVQAAERHAATIETVTSVWPPSAATPGVLEVAVRNTGNVSWLHDVALSYHWLDASGRRIAEHFDNRRTSLPNAVRPGQRAAVKMTVTAAPCAMCSQIEVDMVREQVTWFSKVGTKTPIVSL